MGDDREAQRRNLDLLQQAKAGGMAETTFESLMNDTFTERRHFVQTIAKSSAEVLHKCPYLGKRENVSNAIVYTYYVCIIIK